MSYLQDRKIYLSGPIEHDDGCENWRTEPKKVLTERFGLKLFDPYADPKQQFAEKLRSAMDDGDWDYAEKIAKDFVSKDLTKVDRSDFIIACLPKDVMTTGTHHEIVYSNDRKKPTIICCPQGVRFIPAWYFGFRNIMRFGDWESVYNYLQEVDDGKHMNNNRWKYTYGLI